MRTAIIDDAINTDWVNQQGVPVATLAEIKKTIADMGFTVAVSGRSLMLPPATYHDIDFCPIEASCLDGFDLHAFDTILVDYSLKGHDDNEGIELAVKLVAEGFPVHRILLVSRHQGQALAGKRIDNVLVHKKAEAASIAQWLLKHVNCPIRKNVPSSALCDVLKPGSLIDKAIHGTLNSGDLKLANPIIALRNVLDGDMFPEVNILAGLDGSPGIDAVWNEAVARDILHERYLPASERNCDAGWEAIKNLINCDYVSNLVPLRTLRLLDWLFPRPTVRDEKQLVMKILEKSCSGHNANAQALESLTTASWISDVQSYKDEIRVPISCWLDFLDANLIANSAKSAQRTWKVGLFAGNPTAAPVFVAIECHGPAYPSIDAFMKCVGKVFRRTRSYCHVFSGAKIAGQANVVELLPDGYNPKERRIASNVVHFKGHEIDFRFGDSGAPSSVYVWIVDIA